MDQQTTAAAPAAGSAATLSGEMASGGARLLRSFFGAWRALTMRGARDRTFLSSLAELQQIVAALWAEGAPAQLVRYGRSLMAGPEAIEPRSLLRLQAEALEASGRVARGRPDRLILAAARETDSDLIVLATHGRAGTDAFWSGTLTPKLLRGARASFLLVPAPDAAAGS